jgi:hypothetical protein
LLPLQLGTADYLEVIEDQRFDVGHQLKKNLDPIGDQL